MKDQRETKKEPVDSSQESADERKPYSSPEIRRHGKLSIITAGSISEAEFCIKWLT